VSLSPLQTAVERTTRKTSELAILEMRLRDGDESNVSSMTEAIKSSVDPASTTSVSLYRELLPHQHPQDDEETEPRILRPLENALKVALLDFASTLRHCLTIHSRSTSEATQHELGAQFSLTFAPELTQLSPSIRLPTAQTMESWIPAHGYSPTKGPPMPNLSETPTNGDQHDAEAGVHDFAAQYGTEAPNSRKRLSSFIKRAAGVERQQQPQPQIQPPPTTNGIPSTSRLPSAVSHSQSSSRATSRSRADKRKSRLSWRGSDDGRRPVESKSQTRAGKDSDTRPVTAQSAATAKTVSSMGKKGSLRKRLSTLGIGKKTSRATLVGNRDGTLREE